MPTIIQRSFTSGEIAPALRSRADLTKYVTGLARCENFFVRAQGGVYSRPGFRFIAEVPYGSGNGVARLIPFSFNTEQTYVLLFQENTMYVIRDGGFVLSGGVPLQVPTPYGETEVERLGYTQSADVMTLVHPNHNPYNLSRLADNIWSLAPISYASSVVSPTIGPLSTVGSGAGTYTKTYEYVATRVNSFGVESLASAPVSLTTNSLTTTAGIEIDLLGGPLGTDEYYRIYKAASNGSGVYGWIGDTRSESFIDFNIAPITSDAPPEDRQPFATPGNFPSTVNYYQQRQVFANTYNEPQAVYTTQIGDYRSLRTSNPSRDDDAITFTVAGQQVNEIRHIISLNAMILLTSAGSWLVTEGQNQVFTPSTVGVRAQGYNGSSWVRPAIINDAVVFVQEKGSRIRDLNYEFSSDKYTGNDLSVMSEHLFEGHTIVDMAYAAEPYSILWCVRDDGVLLGLTYLKEHQVWGWHKHTTDGQFESITTINEDGRDTVYVVVRRNVNGDPVKYVERLEKRITDNSEDAFYVDSGLSYSGDPVTVISGLSHLEGKDVVALADGNVVDGLTVSGGSITLPNASRKVHVGLRYTPIIETLDIDSAREPLKSYRLSVSEVTIDFQDSRGGWVSPLDDNFNAVKPIEIKPRFDVDGYDSIPLRSFKSSIYIDPQWNKGGGLRIEQRDPLPMAILSIIPDVSIGG